mmetsp:Transcript_18116/g.36486  ORF Transcript_18116/g.36486 Transcript_18116/m.36486 type:complete len:191 (-) Transcript_18116:1354-1926(-)
MVLSTLAEEKEDTTSTSGPTEAEAEKAAAAQAALENAREKVKASFSNTRLGIGEKEQLFPQFLRSELQIGNVLGKGGFGTVSEILAIRIKQDTKHNSFSFRSWANIASPAVVPPKPSSGGIKLGKKKSQEQAMEEEEPEYVPEFDPDFDESAFQTKKFMQDFVLGKRGAARYAIKEISPEVKANPTKFIR